MLPLDFILFLQIIIFMFITPGTPRIVIISYSMNYGVQKCVWTALGDVTANIIQATLVIFVIGSFLSDNPELISKILAKRGCNKVLWECGPNLATAAIRSNCIQEIITFIAPKLLGGENSMNPIGDFEFEEMHETINLSDSKVSLIGNDICVKSLFKN